MPAARGRMGPQNLAAAMLKAGEARRRNRQWHRCRLPNQCRGKRALADVDHDSLTQPDRTKCVAVLSKGKFFVGASVRVFEERPWHATTREFTQIRDRGDRRSDVGLPITHDHQVAASGGGVAAATARRQALPLGNA